MSQIHPEFPSNGKYIGRGRKNETGHRFGRLRVVALDPAYVTGTGSIRWLCVCDCGATKSVAATSLRGGDVKSCGCYNRDQTSIANRIHGQTGTPEYSAWLCMRGRCRYPKYKGFHRYGGRGIKVCRRWYSFQAFFDDMGPRPSSRHTLDRKDNNGNYEPNNCRWATPEEQGANRSDNNVIVIDGERKTLTQWSRISGLSRATIHARLKSNWPARKAVFHRRIVC